MKFYFQIFLCLFITSLGFGLFHSCAVEAAPLGGPKDTQAPLPDSLKSTPNQQLFFEKQDITLAFNEWIQLVNQNQIIVSPPLEYPLDVKMKGKKVVISFDENEELKENTTYTINLGQSIVDYTERNPMGNYTHVFSTGGFIDSLRLSGKLIDDYTKEPLENITIALYDNLLDSAIYNQRPLYFTRTDENGNFTINNVRQDTFRIIGLDDKNLNFYKDQENEGLAFLDSLIFLDTAFNAPVNLGFFVPDPSLRISEKKHKYGYLKLGFNRIIDKDSIITIFDPPLNEYILHHNQDSLHVWYKSIEERILITKIRNQITDTTTLILNENQESYFKAPLISSANSTPAKLLGPIDTLSLLWNQGIVDFNASLIQLIDTAIVKKTLLIELDESNPRIMKIRSSWEEGLPYKINFLANAISGFHGINKDTVEHKFTVGKNANFGEIVFELDSLNTNYNYLIELEQGQNKKWSKSITNVKNGKITFHSLQPGKYEVKIYEDQNRNGRWDPGDYNSNRYSEKWLTKPLESLKANWTLQVKVNGIEFR